MSSGGEVATVEALAEVTNALAERERRIEGARIF